ncbi:MAG: lipoprotein transmembrane [Rubrivivax sp.]|nr:MAG: lipoprotein transmembrane [Rubrivivax sp.]
MQAFLLTARTDQGFCRRNHDRGGCWGASESLDAGVLLRIKPFVARPPAHRDARAPRRKFRRPLMTMPAARRWMAGLGLAFGLAGLSQALEVGGLTFDDAVTVAGVTLKPNGAGVRTRVNVNVYSLALYLPEKKSSTGAVLEVAGPRRLALGLLRQATGDELGQAFIAGIMANSDKAERARLASAITQFSDAFVGITMAGKGDVITMDWLPEVGTVTAFNGKPLGEPIKDLAFYNTLLKIWLGSKPVDASLKPQLLGAKG